jgi:hypothetical protein
MTFYATTNSISITNSSGLPIFTTDRRMPHIVSSISGNLTTEDATIVVSGSTNMNSRQEIYVDSSPNYVFANSFVWGYLKPVANVQRTEIATGNPIFICGTICVRLYIQDNGYRGSLLLTPRAFDGHIGFVQEHTYNYTGTPPVDLHVDITNTYSNPAIQFSYTLYYGRFL